MEDTTRVIPLQKPKKRLRFFSAPYGVDKPFLILMLIVLTVGLVSLISASYAYAYYYMGDSYYFARRQLLWAVIGLAAMAFFSRVNYHIYHKLAWVVWIISIGLLALVLVMPPINSVHRWISLGPMTFQPSEVGKFALILLMAHLISLNYNRQKSWGTGFFLPLFLIGATGALVLIETHLSGAILIVGMGLILWFVGGVSWPKFLTAMGTGVAGGVAFLLLSGHEADRLQVWQDPLGVFASGMTGRNQAWQTVQSLYAIGSGGLFGQGIGNSRQKYLFLPEPQNDFIFSIVCEEMGFIGAVIILLLFAALVWRGFYIGFHAPDKFGGLLAIGLSAQIGLQVLLNIAVITNLIPNTGISLPFFSYGGSSMCMLLAQMGIILNISGHINREKI